MIPLSALAFCSSFLLIHSVSAAPPPSAKEGWYARPTSAAEEGWWSAAPTLATRKGSWSAAPTSATKEGWSAAPAPAAEEGCLNQANNSTLTVDVGHTEYQGFYNETSNLFSWEGMQYGHVTRFQQATMPAAVSGTQLALAQGPHCSQFQANGIDSPVFPGEEQCLFLNVYVPKALRCSRIPAPVVVWIHGGGYGYGYPDAFGTATNALDFDDGKTIMVTIQYRLGVFGFLAGSEIHQSGESNLGIYDQILALQWVHEHISAFGGNPEHVTIWGESAGAGSAMMLTQAFGGKLGTSLWQGCISNSPYEPIQYTYDDPVPQNYYNSMLELTNCTGPDNFTCLSNAPYESTFWAGSNLSQTLSPYGQWSANPVTDGRILLEPPSQALYPGKVNGEYMYAGHLTHEGHVFANPNITTMASLNHWFDSLYPLVSDQTRDLVWEIYPEAQYSNDSYTNNYLRGAALVGDWTFRCPAYWLAAAFPEGKGFKYIDNIGTAYHGSDLTYFFNDAGAASNESSARAYLVGSMTAFWQTWNPTTNPAVSGLDWKPFDAATAYNEITYALVDNTTNSDTYAYVSAFGVAEPSECTFLRAIGPQIPE